MFYPRVLETRVCFRDERMFWRRENVLETRECFGDESMFWRREYVLETREASFYVHLMIFRNFRLGYYFVLVIFVIPTTLASLT